MCGRSMATSNWKPYKQKPNKQLELAAAREIWGTFVINKDKDNMIKLLEGQRRFFDADGVKRIHNYMRMLRDGEIE